MNSLLQDLSYAARAFTRRPSFALAVVVTLAVGIGANSAIFSVVNGVLLRPLPYEAQDRLVRVFGRYVDFGRTSFSYPDFVDLRAQATTLDRVAAYTTSGLTLTGAAEPERLENAPVIGDLFGVLGVRPLLGRTFRGDDERYGSHRVAVLSHRLWTRRFAADPAVVGRVISLNGNPYVVIGVAPPTMRLPTSAELWTPFAVDPANPPPHRRSEFLAVIGRTKSGASLERARADVAAVAKRLAQEYPQTNDNFLTEVSLLREEVVGPIRPALIVFAAAVALVLLVACGNVANLMLARAAARTREIAVRVSLGAGRQRLVRQLLTESLLLALIGGALGLALAAWGVGGLKAMRPGNVPRIEEIALDWRVIAFTLGVSVFTGLVFGLTPALQAARGDLRSGLQAGGRGMSGGSLDRMRSALVAAQVGFALVLLVGAGLLIKSFARLQDVDPGFRPDNLLTFRVSLPRPKYNSDTTRRLLFEELEKRLTALPGAQSVGAVTTLPIGGDYSYTSFFIEGVTERIPGMMHDAVPLNVTPDYLRTLGIRLRSGRAFTSQDGPTSAPVALVNVEMARRYWRGKDPIGSRITTSNPDNPNAIWRTVVGVIENTRLESLDREPYPQMLFPTAQRTPAGLDFVIRASVPPASLVPAVRREVRALDRDLPVFNVKTMDERLAEVVAQPKVNLLVLAAFAALALVIAAVGTYGVMAYAVAQRTRELGIRVALGASGDRVVRLVVRQGMLPAVAGIAIGLVGAALGARLLATQRRSRLLSLPSEASLSRLATSRRGARPARIRCWLCEANSSHGHAPAGPPLLAPRPAQESRLHHDRGALPRARHWGQFDDLQRRQRDDAAPFAVCRPGSADLREGDAPRRRARQRGPVVSGLPRREAARNDARGHRRVHVGALADVQRRRGARARARQFHLMEPVPDDRRQADARSQLSPGRG
jgi:putative ABC transport system permease protein